MITVDLEKDYSFIQIPLAVPPYPPSPKYPDWPSAWKGLEIVIPAIIQKFNIRQNTALEFGVEYGYSTGALAQLFDKVTGVDTFLGDQHSLQRDSFYDYTKTNLEPFPNIQLHQMDYREWIAKDDQKYDLCHIDIVHTYEDTFTCGRWATDHASVVLFHDTESYSDVKRAVADIAHETGKIFYNYPFCYGLGILV